LEKISDRQLTLIGANFVLAATLISVPAQVIEVAKENAWFSIFPVIAICTISLWLLSKIMARFPDQDLLTAMVSRYSILGRALTFFYLAFFFVSLTRDIRNATELINGILLRHTPLAAVTFLIALTVILIARGGAETGARLVELYFPVVALAIIMLPILLLGKIDVRNAVPPFEEGMATPLKGSWYLVGYIGEIIVLPFLYSNRTFTFRKSFYGFLMGCFLFEIAMVLIQLVCGYELASRLTYPTHELIRHIRLGDFLDRFDLPLLSIWLPSLIIKLGILLYVITHGLKQMVPKASAKELTVPVGVFAFVCSLWFYQNNLSLLGLNRVWPMIMLIPILLIPSLLYIILRPQKKDRPSSNAEGDTLFSKN
jgi:spore germination protein